MAELLSQRKYAEWRKARGLSGGSLAAVQKAIETKRITLVVDAGTGKLKIDPAIADAQWERNTDPDQQLRGNGGVLPVGQDLVEQATGAVPASGGQREATDEVGDDDSEGAAAGGDKQELLRHKRESAELDTELKRIQLAKARGELVSLAEEREVRVRRYRAIRDKLLGIADREAAVLAAERDAVQVHAVLTRAIKQVLHELSDDARAEADRGLAEPVAA